MTTIEQLKFHIHRGCKGRPNIHEKLDSLIEIVINNEKNVEIIDGLTTLLPEDDIATIRWGGKWRLPTSFEWQELINNCDFKWINRFGTRGLFVKSRKNGNTLFLPAYDDTFCEYWSSSLQQERYMLRCWNAMAFLGNEYRQIFIAPRSRSAYLSIRPVFR